MKYELINILKDLDIDQSLKLNLKENIFKEINKNEEIRKKIVDFEIKKLKELNEEKNKNISIFKDYIEVLNQEINKEINTKLTKSSTYKSELGDKKNEQISKIKEEIKIFKASLNYNEEQIKEDIEKIKEKYEQEIKRIKKNELQNCTNFANLKTELLNKIAKRYLRNKEENEKNKEEYKAKIKTIDLKNKEREENFKLNSKNQFKFYNQNIALLKEEKLRQENIETTLYKTHIQELANTKTYYEDRFSKAKLRLKSNYIALKEKNLAKENERYIEKAYHKKNRSLDNLITNFDKYHFNNFNYYQTFLKITKEKQEINYNYKANIEKAKIELEVAKKKSKEEWKRIQYEKIKSKYEKEEEIINEKQNLADRLKAINEAEINKRYRLQIKKEILSSDLNQYLKTEELKRELKGKESEKKYSDKYSKLFLENHENQIKLIKERDALYKTLFDQRNKLLILKDTVKLINNNYKKDAFNLNEELLYNDKRIAIKTKIAKRELVVMISLIAKLFAFKQILIDENIDNSNRTQEAWNTFDQLITKIIVARSKNIIRLSVDTRIEEQKQELMIKCEKYKNIIIEYQNTIKRYKNEKKKKKLIKRKKKYLKKYYELRQELKKVINENNENEKIKYHFYYELLNTIKNNKKDFKTSLANFYKSSLHLIKTRHDTLISKNKKKYNRLNEEVKRNIKKQYNELEKTRLKEEALIRGIEKEILKEEALIEIRKESDELYLENIKETLLKETTANEKELNELLKKEELNTKYYEYQNDQLFKKLRIKTYRQKIALKKETEKNEIKRINNIYNKDRDNKEIELNNAVERGKKEQREKQSVLNKLKREHHKLISEQDRELNKLKLEKEKQDKIFLKELKILSNLELKEKSKK